MRRLVGFLGALLIASPCFASDVVVESRPVASWQHQPNSEYQGADKWLRLQNQVEQLQQELQTIRGMAEQSQYALKKQQEESRALFEDVDKRLGEFQEKVMQALKAQSSQSQAMPSAKAMDIDAPIASSAVVLPKDEKQAYDAAHDLMEAKSYAQALETFLAFETAFPNSEYLPNVYYWLGEIYLLGQDLEAADAAFAKVIEHYPSNPKVADALLKRGYVQYALSNWTLARAYFNDVKARFQGTSAARLAQARLVQMKQNKQL